MATYSFFAHGIPKGQPRARAVVRGKHAGVFDPGTADGWKAIVRDASRAVKPKDVILTPVLVSIGFVFARPNSHLNTKGAIKPAAPRYHTQKPDLDNLAKAVLDALTNEGWWKDDAQIYTLTLTRSWGIPTTMGADVQVFVPTA